jgi:hypothetical protein
MVISGQLEPRKEIAQFRIVQFSHKIQESLLCVRNFSNLLSLKNVSRHQQKSVTPL